MTDSSKNDSLKPYDDIMGLNVSPERLKKNLEVYKGILRELKKLRSLELTNLHPSVVFTPSGLKQEDNLDG